MNSYRKYKTMIGKGKGGVLLRPFQGGMASSYNDLEEYLEITGKGICTEPNHMRGRGKGYDSNSNIIETSLGRKMAKLQVKPIERKPKRIQLN